MIRQSFFITAAALLLAPAASAQGPDGQAVQPQQPRPAAAQDMQAPLNCALWAERERLGANYRHLAQAQGRDTAETWLKQQATAFNLHAARMGKTAMPCPA
ncbi:hypothetical protein SAMN05421641_10286 [Paracoccus thiocyanatus]|uniref:Uncharacterized protein n=1 Tax=Paracoccus thiocyanatus TaxID=34006 RepID=A0A1N6NSV2_9RHOB|nr:hypothetical protein [Paracoccus thiocyanatus]SIP95218.1 hypothetical protein SAMN05421641_10286 [Paracoccus thiocyanatus]